MVDSTPLWRGRRVLVTGGTGFLGGTVVEELLARGAEVVGLVRDRTAAIALARHQLAGRVHIVHGRADDLFRIHSALAVYEASAVLHLIPAPAFGLDRAAASVLDAVHRYDPRIPVVVARPALAAPVLSSPVPMGVARFGELFGRDPNTHRFVPATSIALFAGDRIPSTAERGAQDYVHVRDAARACLMLAEAVASRPTPHVYEANFRSGWMLTDREMLSALREARANFAAASFQLAESKLETGSHIPPANPLGWSPSLSFAEAIADTVEWYRTFVRSGVSGARPSEPARAA